MRPGRRRRATPRTGLSAQDRVVVADQQLAGVHLHGRHLLNLVPVAGVPPGRTAIRTAPPSLERSRSARPRQPRPDGRPGCGSGATPAMAIELASGWRRKASCSGLKPSTTRWTTPRILPKASTSNSALVIGGTYVAVAGRSPGSGGIVSRRLESYRAVSRRRPNAGCRWSPHTMTVSAERGAICAAG